MSEHNWIETQGQYLAFIYNYTVIHGQPPSEVDLRRFFRVTPPTIHQMVLRLEEKGFICRTPGKAPLYAQEMRQQILECRGEIPPPAAETKDTGGNEHKETINAQYLPN